MDRKLRDDRSRLAVSLGVGVAVFAMIAMGLVLLPLAPHLPSGEKTIEMPQKATPS